MRRYWDQTERERSVVTDEEMAAFLAIEMMERGVVKPVAPVLEATEEVPLATKTVIVIKGGTYENRLSVCFSTTENALAFLRLEPWVIEPQWEAGGLESVRPLGGANVAQLDLPHYDAALASAAILKERLARIARNAALTGAYKKALAAIDQETAVIRSDRLRCQDRARVCSNIWGTWVVYQELADGNKQTAWAFLLKAFGGPAVSDAFEWLDEPEGWAP